MKTAITLSLIGAVAVIAGIALYSWRAGVIAFGAFALAAGLLIVDTGSPE